jgi:hypothetical protein
MKWALQQFSDWFTEAQEQLEPEVSLILLVHRMSHCLKPEAMKDVVKYLKGMQNTISKHVSNFRVNTKMAGEGKSYPMYLKLRIGTNVFGDNLTQLIQDLRSISSNVACRMEVNSPEGRRHNSRMVENYTPKFSFAMDYQLGQQHRRSTKCWDMQKHSPGTR